MTSTMDRIPLNEHTKPMVIKIMNNKHADALLSILHYFKFYGRAATARLQDLDESTMTIVWASKNPATSLEGPAWPTEVKYQDAERNPVAVVSIGDCLRTLANMAQVAREALDVKLPVLPVKEVSDVSPAPSGAGTAQSHGMQTLRDTAFEDFGEKGGNGNMMAMMASTTDRTPLNENTKPIVIRIMNNMHADALLSILHHFKYYGGAATAHLQDLDESTMTITWTSKNPALGQEGKAWPTEVKYQDAERRPVVVGSIGECLRTLANMARIAKEASDVKTESPSAKEASEVMPAPSGTRVYASKARSRGIRTLQDMASEGLGQDGSNEDMMAMMEQLMAKMEDMMSTMALNGRDKGKSRGLSMPAEGASNVFMGEGSTLGSADTDTSPLSAERKQEESHFQLREVDLSKPTVQLRVRLVDQKTVVAVLNDDFNLQDLRAWLEHQHAASFAKAYHLMDVNGYPAKKLTDNTATLQQLGLTKPGACVGCRPA